jgi:hypothetical protein
VRPLSCPRLSIGNIIEFLCWKWKPYPRVVFRKFEYRFIYTMRSLLRVESLEFRPSNQYILVRAIPSCFRFAKICLCQVSVLSRCNPRYLTSSFWGVAHCSYGPGGTFLFVWRMLRGSTWIRWLSFSIF